MKIKSIIVAVLCIITFPRLSSGADLTPQEIIEKVEQTFYKQKSLYAVFQETYIWGLTGEEQTVKGELLLEGDKKFFISTGDQIIVSDGTILKTYNQVENQVLIDRLETTEDDLLPSRILFKYKQQYDSRLLGEEAIQGEKCYEILFTPSEGDLFYNEVHVWVDAQRWIPRKIEQKSIDGNTTVYLLTEIKLGVEVQNSDFTLDAPENAEIIDMR